MIPLINPGDSRSKSIRLYQSLVVGKDGMFDTLFGLSPSVGFNSPVKESVLRTSYLSDPLISDADKGDPSKQAMLLQHKKETYERLRSVIQETTVTGPLADNQLRGYRTLSILHYMHEHPGVSFQDAMDPTKDVLGKRMAANDVLAASATTAKVYEETRGTSKAKIIADGTEADIAPILTGAIQVLNTLDVRDIALDMLGVQPPTTPEEAKAIFSDPKNQCTIRPIMAAISAFYEDSEQVMQACGALPDSKVSGLKGKIHDAVMEGLTPEERKQWELTNRNLPNLKSESFLYQLSVSSVDSAEDMKANKGLLDEHNVAEAMVRSTAMRDRIATVGTLASMDSEPAKTASHLETLDLEGMVFGDQQLSGRELLTSDAVRSRLDQGLSQESRTEAIETMRFSDPIPDSPTADIRRELAQARTPAQMEAVIEALDKAAPGLLHKDAVKGMIVQTRLTSNSEDISYVDPAFQPAKGKKTPADANIQTIAMLKPEVYDTLRSAIEDACDRIDVSEDPKLHAEKQREGLVHGDPALKGAQGRYQAERASQEKDDARKEELQAGRKALDTLSGITQDRVQTMEDLYSRMKADQSRTHRDSDEYKDMYQAVTAIHERAAKGYDPKDPVQQAEMSKLFSKAYQTAQVYADKEVAGKEKKSQRGLDRKNFTLTVLTNTCQHRDGANTWYLPAKYDPRRSTKEDPKTAETLGLDNLLKEEKRHNRSFREFLTGLNPFSAPLPKKEKKPIERKEIHGKKTSLQKLMEQEKKSGKPKAEFHDEELEKYIESHPYTKISKMTPEERAAWRDGRNQHLAAEAPTKTPAKKGSGKFMN